MAIPLTALAAGAVIALLVGVFGLVHDPTVHGTTTLGYPTLQDMKTVVATVVAVLAVLVGDGASHHRGHRAGAHPLRCLLLPVGAGPRGRSGPSDRPRT